MPREKTADESAGLARQRRDNPAVVRAMEAGPKHAEKEDWRKAHEFASLVNYATAPIGGQTYDSAWLASNAAR